MWRFINKFLLKDISANIAVIILKDKDMNKNDNKWDSSANSDKLFEEVYY